MGSFKIPSDSAIIFPSKKPERCRRLLHHEPIPLTKGQAFKSVCSCCIRFIFFVPMCGTAKSGFYKFNPTIVCFSFGSIIFINRLCLTLAVCL